MREPSGAVRPMVSGGDEGGRSQSGANRSTGRGGVTGSAAGRGDGGYTCLGEAGDRKTRDLSNQPSVRGEDEGLKGTRKDGSEGLTESG